MGISDCLGQCGCPSSYPTVWKQNEVAFSRILGLPLCSPTTLSWDLEKTAKAAALGNKSQDPVWSEVTFSATHALATCPAPSGFPVAVAPAPTILPPEPVPVHSGDGWA